MKKIIISTIISLTITSVLANDTILKGFTFDGGVFIPSKDIKSIILDNRKAIDLIELNNYHIIYGEEVERFIIEKEGKLSLPANMGTVELMMLEGGDRSGGGAI